MQHDKDAVDVWYSPEQHLVDSLRNKNLDRNFFRNVSCLGLFRGWKEWNLIGGGGVAETVTTRYNEKKIEINTFLIATLLRISYPNYLGIIHPFLLQQDILGPTPSRQQLHTRYNSYPSVL